MGSRSGLNKTSVSVVSMAVSLGMAGFAAPAAAQDTTVAEPQAVEQAAPVQATGPVLEDIVVTARKREERTIDAPLAISAFSEKAIQEKQLTEIKDIANVSPGLSYIPSGGSQVAGRSNGQIVFRGLSTTYGTAREQSGSAFVDGIYISTGVGSLSTVDVERVEVLKGPQSTYFGRNTFGGAINFITRRPKDSFGGQIDGLGTLDGSHDLTLSIEGPLIQNVLSGRLTGHLHNKQGRYRTTDGGTLGGEKTKSIDANFYLTPSDSFELNVRGHYQKNEDELGATTVIRGTQYGSTCPGRTFNGRNAAGEDVTFSLGRPYFCGDLPSLKEIGGISKNTTMTLGVLDRIGRPNLWRDMLVNNSLGSDMLDKVPELHHMGMAQTIGRVSAAAKYTFPNDITLVSSLAYSSARTLVAYDGDHTDEENTYQFNASTDRNWNYEFRVQSQQNTPFRWLAGMNYFWAKGEGQTGVWQVGNRFGDAPFTAGYLQAYSKSVNQILAGFAAVEYDIIDGLTLAGEVRYQTDKTKTLNTTIDTDSWLPRIILKYKPNPDTTLYANYAKGIQQQQTNGNWVTYTPEQHAEIWAVFPDADVFAPIPTLYSYDIGWKQRLFNGRAQFSLSGYYMDWKRINTQVTVFSQTQPFNLVVIAPNDARLWGIEFDAQAALTDKLTAEMTFNYRHAEYVNFFNPSLSTLTSGVVHFGGNKLPKTPAVTGSFSLSYSDDIDGEWSWFARGDSFYTGKQWDSEANIFQLDDYIRVNARIGVRKDNLSIELFSKNLFNDRHWDSAQRTTSVAEPGALLYVPWPTPTSPLTTVPGVSVYAPAPREVGVRFNVKF